MLFEKSKTKNFNTKLRVWEQRVPKWKRVDGIHFRWNAKKGSVFKAFKPDMKTLPFNLPVPK
ncbi:MAG: hypothetical protein VB018_02685 [Lachnospiraceae bacterium]|nr:hypothetical protein [Lachnospiraceae bacterium]